MKVYIVMFDETEEGHVVSVHATKELAESEMQRLIAEGHHRVYQLDVEEWEVQS